MLFDVCPQSETVFIEYKKASLKEPQERAICGENIQNNNNNNNNNKYFLKATNRFSSAPGCPEVFCQICILLAVTLVWKAELRFPVF